MGKKITVPKINMVKRVEVAKNLSIVRKSQDMSLAKMLNIIDWAKT